jgi:exodeoxyribonuclease-5
MTPDDFAPDQITAVEAAVRWYRSPERGRPFLIHGPAGTGKTSIAKRISELTAPHNTVFVAATGKATAVLHSKGCKARTIHSAIYRPRGEDPEAKALRERRDQMAGEPDPDPETLRRLNQQIKALSGGGFALRDRDKAFDGKLPGLIVVDEGSMVGEKVAADLASFGVPILVLGDPHQLPPVQAKPGFRQRPDVLLSTVHRYAGPLLDMATAARQGHPIPVYDRATRATRAGRYGGRYEIGLLARFDQIIVYRNRTRWDVIRRLREALDRPPGRPVPGDRVMVLRNDPDLDVVNGQQATVAQADPVDDGWLLQTTCGKAWLVDGRGFLGQEHQEAVKADRDSELIAATFAQAITCHAAQGSEWPAVAVIDESPSREWLYTAVTRAQRECIVLTRRPVITPVGGLRRAA